MKHSSLSYIATSVGGAAIAGYGLSVGRDTWKWTKKNSAFMVGLLLIASILALPLIGGRGLVRGYDRGPLATLFRTVLGSLALIVAGFVAVFLVCDFMSGNEGSSSAVAMQAAAGVTAGLASIGLLWGALQRPGRLRTLRAAKANDEFMRSIGITETGGDDITHYAPDGQALRFLEVHKNRLVFMAVGKKGKRAYIDLSDDGRMLSYSGVV